MTIAHALRQLFGNTAALLVIVVATSPVTLPALIWCLKHFFGALQLLDAFFTSIK